MGDGTVGSDPRHDLGHIGVDVAAPERQRHRYAVVAIAHEIDLAHPHQIDRRHRVASAHRGGDLLPASSHALRGRTKAAIEVALAVDGADDQIELDDLEPDA